MEEGDIVIGKVEKVTNTVTFVKLSNGEEATLISSEISPGRIKHLRQFVVPNKTVVCKILEISGDRISVSLRRVNQKEKKEVLQKFKRDQALKTTFNQILKEDSEKVTEKIIDSYQTLSNFINQSKEDSSLLEKFIPTEKIDAIRKVSEKKNKNSTLKALIKIGCLESDGVPRMKKVFDITKKGKKLEVNYISAGNILLKLTVEDFKEGKKRLNEILETLGKRAKEQKCEFHASEER